MTVMTAIGMMSGTSLDGVDAAIIKTDGEDFIQLGATQTTPFERADKVFIRRAIKAALEGRDQAKDIEDAIRAVTTAHIKAVNHLLDRAQLSAQQIDLIGFHGQTILHRPALTADVHGRTWQIGDGARLARETGIDVISDFRSADVEAGGEGAPFAPVYHAALARQSAKDQAVGVINLGGVANITYVPKDGDERGLVAFDCGPGNGLIDEWVLQKTGAAFDEDGALARSGKVHKDVLRMMLLNPYLRREPPKSLDRYDFKLAPVADLTVEDGAATLTAFTAACVRDAEKFLPEPPAEWIVIGGGRLNGAMMEALAQALDGPVKSGEAVGWRGDSVEAECFGYLAVRSAKGLALSLPKTTRVPAPMTGGVIHHAL